MKNYVKAVLYAYPVLKTVEKEYNQHISNMALLSYRSDAPAEVVAERIVGQIVEKDDLLWLKEQTEKIMEQLSELERTLLAVKFFGKERKLKRTLPKADGRKFPFSESKYFRMQMRLGEKMGAKLCSIGLTESEFEKRFAQMELFQLIFTYMQRRENRGLSDRERRWLKG